MPETIQPRMPAVFIGHGTPFNALNDNQFTRTWREFGRSIPKPKAILAVSAHWYIGATAATASPAPKTVHDFNGFPREMYEIDYPAPGSPELVRALQELVRPTWLGLDTADQWGLDHGTWSVLTHMFPEADVPVVQLSVDATQPVSYHLDLGRRLAPLRDEGVLVLGSGNIVHNLGRLSPREEDPHVMDWALAFDAFAKEKLEQGDHRALVDYEKQGHTARLAVPTNDHYLPMLYTLGALGEKEGVRFTHESFQHGSISMRCFEGV